MNRVYLILLSILTDVTFAVKSNDWKTEKIQTPDDVPIVSGTAGHDLLWFVSASLGWCKHEHGKRLKHFMAHTFENCCKLVLI